MMQGNTRLVSLILTVVLVGANLVALNYLVAGWSTARLDLTSEGLYSISPATKRILTNLDEELTILGYFSERTHPKLAPLVPEITDLLDEYGAVSRGRVHVEIIDPGEDEDAEQEASERYGVRSTPFRLASKYESAIVNAYFALVVKFADQYVRYGFDDLISVEPTPDGDIEVGLRNLEYDLTRAIKKVVYGFRATHELFDRIDEPVRVTAIWTPDSLPELLAETPDKVRQAVEELAEASGGDKIVLEEIDPSTDEALRQQVLQRWGARPMSLGLFSEGEFYLYALLQIGQRVEQIMLTGDSVTTASVRESIENALKRSTPGYLKTVGVVTSDPPEIPPEIRMQMNLPPQPPPEFQEVKALLRQDYEVQEVDLDTQAGVPTDVDILLVLKPQNLSDVEIYSLDQYLMRGGRVVLCAGNYDADFGQQGLSLTPVSTGLDDWLAHFGVTIDQTLVLDDRNQPLPLPELRQTPFGTLRTWTLAPYPYLVQVRDEGFRNTEVTTSLDSVGIYWGSPLRVDETATGQLELIPILQSSTDSWTDDDLSRVSYVDYLVPAEGTEPQLLALALAGKFNSYFAGKEIPRTDRATPAQGEEGEQEEQPPVTTVTLEESPPTRLVVVGNAEFLSDFVARALAQVEGGFFVENLRFAQNVIDWVGLDNEMLSIRARGLASRRLDRVDERTKRAVEIVNVLIPIVLLVLLGSYLHLKRRQTLPLDIGTGGSGGKVPAAPASRGGGTGMNRTQIILGGILVVQLALILLVRSPFSSASARAEARPLLPVLEAISPTRLEIDGADDEQIVLQRAGEGWIIDSLDGFPADGQKVTQLLDDLQALQVRRPVVTSGRYHKAFKVASDDNEARLRLWDDASAQPQVDLIVGSSPNYRTIHVRLDGDSDVYEVQGLAAYDVRPTQSTWIEKDLIGAPEAGVNHLRLTNIKGTLELAREDGTWKVVAPEAYVDRALDQSKVESLVRTASTLRLADAVGPVDEAAHGLDQPAATLVLRWTEGGSDATSASPGEATLEVGSTVADKETQRYVTAGGFGFTGAIWESSVKRLLEDDLDALMAQEAEAKAEAEAEQG